MSRNFTLALLLLPALLVAGCGRPPSILSSASGQQNPGSSPVDNSSTPNSQPEERVISVPAGTPVTVRLQTAISSASSRPGDFFDAVIDEPLVVEGQTIVSRGTPVRGKVTVARRSGRLHHPGELGLTLVSLNLQGQDIPVETAHTYFKAKSHKKRNLTLIGGGTGAGALIGGIASGGTGLLIGSAIGGGGGTAVAYGTGKKDVTFGAERRLTFKLTQPLLVKAN
jgi:hypothetical protein